MVAAAASSPHHSVQRCDRHAHIVRFPDQLTAYVVFRPTTGALTEPRTPANPAGAACCYRPDTKPLAPFHKPSLTLHHIAQFSLTSSPSSPSPAGGVLHSVSRACLVMISPCRVFHMPPEPSPEQLAEQAQQAAAEAAKVAASAKKGSKSKAAPAAASPAQLPPAPSRRGLCLTIADPDLAAADLAAGDSPRTASDGEGVEGEGGRQVVVTLNGRWRVAGAHGVLSVTPAAAPAAEGREGKEVKKSKGKAGKEEQAKLAAEAAASLLEEAEEAKFGFQTTLTVRCHGGKTVELFLQDEDACDDEESAPTGKKNKK